MLTEPTHAAPVGTTTAMPGSNGGFSMCVFASSDVPVGSPIYAHPPELAQEVDRLREALRFYADRPCNLEIGKIEVCPYDDGDTARKALENRNG